MKRMPGCEAWVHLSASHSWREGERNIPCWSHSILHPDSEVEAGQLGGGLGVEPHRTDSLSPLLCSLSLTPDLRATPKFLSASSLPSSFKKCQSAGGWD